MMASRDLGKIVKKVVRERGVSMLFFSPFLKIYFIFIIHYNRKDEIKMTLMDHRRKTCEDPWNMSVRKHKRSYHVLPQKTHLPLFK
jgi:hypothetical protein